MLSTPLCYKVDMLHLGRSGVANVCDTLQSLILYKEPLENMIRILIYAHATHSFSIDHWSVCYINMYIIHHQAI